MTVLFAFASSRRPASFICADDLESNNQTKVDKVVLCWERFAVGIYGADVLKEAVLFPAQFNHDVDRVLHGDGSPALSIVTVDQLCDAISHSLPRLVRMHVRRLGDALKNGRISQKQHDDWMAATGGVVILDHEQAELYEAKPSSPLSCAATAAITFSSTRLRDNRAYRFAVNGTQDLGAVSTQMVANPRSWAAPHLVRAKQQCAKAGLHDVIGDLGASFTRRGVSTEFQSSFNSVDEAMTAWGIP